MRWEDLTAASFEDAVERCERVCILPLGVIEAHGPHLPLGTDAIIAHRLACAAAEIEPALVFPPFLWGMNGEARAWPGGVMLRPQLILDLLEGVCSEISRNGCQKIILFSGHGGNQSLLPLFVQSRLDQDVGYVPYSIKGDPLGRDEFFYTLLGQDTSGHAGECETSLMMHLAPQVTHPEWIPERAARCDTRMDHLFGQLYTPVDWYGRYPGHYKNDARPASAEKGKVWFAHRAEVLARIMKVVKEDDVALAAHREYSERIYRR